VAPPRRIPDNPLSQVGKASLSPAGGDPVDGAVGTSADNALAESFNATLKRETLRGGRTWPDPAICRREVFRWVTRYNTRRRHSWCGQQAPITYEQQHAPTLRLAA